MSPIAFRPAKRGQSYVMVGLAGYSGTGKTFSALRLARGLAGNEPFAYIDTESERALHYDWYGQPWHHASLEPPFTPAAYLAAIRDAEKAGYPVIVVDSMSHEYSGSGGLQDQAEAELARMAGDDYGLRAKLGVSSWNKPKQAHRKFVEDLLRIKAHLVLCFRAREAIEMRKNEKGKMEVVPVQSIPGHPGWLIDTEHKNMPLPYELTLSILLIPRSEEERGRPIPVKLEDQHKPYVPLDKPLSEETGIALAKWAAGNKTGSAPTGQAAASPSAPLPSVPPLSEDTFEQLKTAKAEASVSNDWMREQLAAVGMVNVPAQVTLATVKRLAEPQGQDLLSRLNAKVDEALEASA